MFVEPLHERDPEAIAHELRVLEGIDNHRLVTWAYNKNYNINAFLDFFNEAKKRMYEYLLEYHPELLV